MIIVKVELVSAIHSSRSKELGRMIITNDGTGTDKRCSYDVEVMRRGAPSRVQRRARVQDYPRLAYTVWELVKRALEASFGKWPVHPGQPQEFDEEVFHVMEEQPSFEQVWSQMEAKGYQYGPEALEQVRLGWELARGVKP